MTFDKFGIDFTQPSTIRGITALAGALGLGLAPEAAILIVQIVHIQQQSIM